MTTPTPEQAAALPGVLWLLRSGPRGSGKTHLLAHALIETAIMEQGRPVTLFDHSIAHGVSHHISSNAIMGPTIERALEDYPDYNIFYNRRDNTITCTGRRDND